MRLFRPFREMRDQLNQLVEKDIEEAESLKQYGYTPHKNVISGVWDHNPCGTVITDPQVHDPLCPANGNGRTGMKMDGTPAS